MRKILGALRRADERFGLIEQGDSIAVGLSGGKDSMALLYALKLYRMFSKKEYALHGICIDLGFEGFASQTVAEYAHKLEIPVDVIKTDIGEIVFDIRKEKNPCSLCAKMRKGALYERAVSLGCNKAAFAHHMDDALQTFVMSMMYEARLFTLPPKTYLSRTGITLLRPFILAREYDVKAAVKKNEIPYFKNPCPVDEHTVREQSKDVIRMINNVHEGAMENMMGALSNTGAYQLWDRFENHPDE